MEWYPVSHPEMQNPPWDLRKPWHVQTVTSSTRRPGNKHISRKGDTTAVLRSPDASSKQKRLGADLKASNIALLQA